MSTPQTLIVFFCAFALLAPTGVAEPPEIPTVELRTLGITHGISTDLFYHTEDRFEKLPLAYFRPSATLRASLGEDGRLPLFSRVTTPEEETEYILHSRVSIPNGSRQILILGAQVEDRVVMNAVTDNLSKSNRDWLFINISTMPIAVELGAGNDLFVVPPGQSILHEARVEAGEGASIKVVVYKENEWERVYSRFWPIYHNQRSMVVFLEVDGRVRVHNFFEAVKRP